MSFRGFFKNICIQHYIDILNNYTSVVVMLFRKGFLYQYRIFYHKVSYLGIAE